MRGAVHFTGLHQLMRDLQERLPDQKDREDAYTVGENQAGIGIQQMQLGQHKIAGQVNCRSRNHITEQNHSRKKPLQTEFHMRQRIGHHTGINDLQNDNGSGDKNAVAHVPCERGLIPGRGKISPERHLGPERRRGAPDFIIGFQRTGDHPVEWKSHQQGERGKKQMAGRSAQPCEHTQAVRPPFGQCKGYW
ncbi:hypothetical protein D3C75_797260 [compost metagenome]